MALKRVLTRYGEAEGVDCNGVTVFKGVPFAVPPVGELRWKRTVPLPEECWEGVRVFDRPGPICPQVRPERSGKESGDDSNMSEDCLYLNIWTPAETSEDRLPVLVWIHGGSFVFGSPNENLYDADHMCRKGIIVVSISYRLNWFGFFSHPELDKESDEGVSGNYGLWDEVEALKWIRGNIAAFGGDPNRVTVAGQSAGGASISALLAFPEAKGLFRGAIIESGVHDTDKLNATLGEAEEILRKFLTEKGYGGCTIDELRRLPAQELLQMEIPTWFGELPPLRPVIDGFVQPLQSYDMFRLARIHDVAIIFGTNGFEGNMGPRGCDYERFMEFIKGYAGEDYEKFFEVYPVTRENFEFIRHIVGRDKEYTNLCFLAKRLCRKLNSPIYQYHFAQGVLQEDGSVIQPYHHMELYYVWNKLELQPGVSPVIREKHMRLADRVESYWVNFVKTGNPNGEGLPEWPAYTEQDERHLRIEADRLEARTSHYPVGTGLIEKMMDRAELSR